MRNKRLSKEEALDLLTDAPQVELMAKANAVRQAMHPNTDVTYVIDTNPNYTNVCETACTFCSFYRRPGEKGVYLHSPESMAKRVRAAQQCGATTVLLQGGHHPDVTLDYCLALLRFIKEAAPGIHLHPFSPSEIVHLSETSAMAPESVLDALWEAGVRTMPGGGAEILVDRVRRRISPKKINADIWLHMMRLAHQRGMKTSATMTYGHVETPEDIIEHLMRLRDLQDETGGFYAFIPWSFKPGASPLSRLVERPALSSRYVRIIAVSRLVLDNIPHIQASWFGEGWRAGQLALHAGADDFGGLLIEENVLRNAGHDWATTKVAMLETIREAGYVPVQRTTLYEKIGRDEKSISDVSSRPGVMRRAECGLSIQDNIGAEALV